MTGKLPQDDVPVNSDAVEKEAFLRMVLGNERHDDAVHVSECLAKMLGDGPVNTVRFSAVASRLVDAVNLLANSVVPDKTPGALVVQVDMAGVERISADAIWRSAQAQVRS
jgi:hypothetical protein